MTEQITAYRCPDHGLQVKALGRGPWRCPYFVTNAQCRKPMEPVVMVPQDEQPELRRMEVREDDLVLYWPNGDPAVKFQADGPFIVISASSTSGASCIATASSGCAWDRVWAERNLGAAA